MEELEFGLVYLRKGNTSQHTDYDRFRTLSVTWNKPVGEYMCTPKYKSIDKDSNGIWVHTGDNCFFSGDLSGQIVVVQALGKRNYFNSGELVVAEKCKILAYFDTKLEALEMLKKLINDKNNATGDTLHEFINQFISELA